MPKAHPHKAIIVALVPGLTLLLSLAPATSMSQSLEERKARIEELQSKPPSKEALDRKNLSIAKLNKEGVPILADLHVIADSTSAKKRTTEEIAHRTIAVFITAVKGEGLEQEVIDEQIEKFGASKFFTPEEAAFIKWDPLESTCRHASLSIL